MFSLSENCIISIKESQNKFFVLVTHLDNEDEFFKLSGCPAILMAMAKKDILSSEIFPKLEEKFNFSQTDIEKYIETFLEKDFITQSDTNFSKDLATEYISSFNTSFENLNDSCFGVISIDSIEEDLLNVYAAPLGCAK